MSTPGKTLDAHIRPAAALATALRTPGPAVGIKSPNALSSPAHTLLRLALGARDACSAPDTVTRRGPLARAWPPRRHLIADSITDTEAHRIGLSLVILNPPFPK